MGAVWAADQYDPIRRAVAVKLIKPGMDSWQVVARFEAERRALALMDHPNIARVLDAGRTPAGRPFVVMELVDGQPVMPYAADRRLSVRERLELFVGVCRAVTHAHQKGVIHRDIKPSNILVAEVDGRPVPKVIDFGIAKAVDAGAAAPSQTAAAGGVLGTLEYMAPEQAEPGASDVDTRADVYALGALLYELLVGSPPLPGGELRRVTLTEALRRVREDVPPRPSARLAALPEEHRHAVAAERRTDPGRLDGQLRRELDWVVMKALEKDRDRRYTTAAEFAADVRGYLAGEPVLARPPGRGYRLGKFVRKNRVVVAAAAVAVLALLGGTAAAVVGLVRAQEAIQEAVAAQRLEADQRRVAAEQKRTAEQSAAAAREASESMRDLLGHVRQHVFAAGRPVGLQGGRGRNLTLREAIDAALPAIDKDFADHPMVEARLRHWIGQSYLTLGEPTRAVEQLSAAARLDREHPPADPADGYALMKDLAQARLYAGQLREAIDLLERTTPECEARLGPDHPTTLAAQLTLAVVYDLDGRSQAAIELLERVVAEYTRRYGRDNPDSRFAASCLALAYGRAGRTNDAVTLAEKLAVGIDSRPDHGDTLDTLWTLGSVYGGAGRPDRAAEAFAKALPHLRAKLGPRHPDTLRVERALGAADVDCGRASDGVGRLEKACAASGEILGPNHPDTLAAATELARGYTLTGRPGRAAEILERVVPRCREVFGPDNSATLLAVTNLATAYEGLGRPRETAGLMEKVVAIYTSVLGPRHPNTLVAEMTLAGAYTGSDRVAEAIEILERVAAVYRADLPPDHPDALTLLNKTGKAYQQAGRTAEAVEVFKTLVTRRTAAAGAEHPDTLIALTNLASAFSASGRPGEAAGLLEKAIPTCRTVFGPEHPATLNALSSLAVANWKSSRRAEAARLFEQVYPSYAAVVGERHPDTLRTAVSLASAYLSTGRPRSAVALLEQVTPLFRDVFGERHHDTLTAEAVLANAYAWDGRHQEAAALLRRVYPAQRAALGPDHPDTVLVMSNLALACYRSGRAEEAQDLLEKAIPLCVARLGSGHSNTISCRTVLAGAYTRAGRWADAEPHLLAVYRGLKDRGADSPPAYRVDAARQLVTLYEGWGKPEQARVWRAELDRLPREVAPAPRTRPAR
jgi:tetratricopeptide (TPR) repeat protein